ncbi:MAG TPA: hypothetical protein VL651_17215 [Bacteroidia bacterium]|jgi:hypothetical protein|nr:hypothetical protein [Bacteroidia bacterium]
MRSTLLFFLLVFPTALFSQRRFSHAHHYTSHWKNNQTIEKEGTGFGAWLNQYGALGGGIIVEYGDAYPLISWNQQVYFMADCDFRLSAIKHTSAGIGGSVAAEFRIYDRSHKYARYGIEASWGLNGMLYVNEHDDAIGHILYGGNWYRAGFIQSKHVIGDKEYYAEFQYWQNNWYVSFGLSMEGFNRKHSTRHVRAKF